MNQCDWVAAVRALNLATRSVTSDKALAHNSVEMNFHIEMGSETSKVFIRRKKSMFG